MTAPEDPQRTSENVAPRPPEDSGKEGRTVHVHFADAPSDVLTWLADQPHHHWFTPSGVADRVAPPDALDALESTCTAMRTLRDCGLIEGRLVDGDIPMWRATDEGRRAVETAQSTAEGVA